MTAPFHRIFREIKVNISLWINESNIFGINYLKYRKLLQHLLNFSFNSAFVSMCFYRHTRTIFYAGILHSIRFDLRRNKTNTIEGLQTFMILLSHRATICEYFFYFLHTETCKSSFHSILSLEQLFPFFCVLVLHQITF